jgi:zinc protease
MKKINCISKAFFTFLVLSFFIISPVSAGDNIKEIDVDGLKVIIKNTGKNVISARLFIVGGTANYPLEKQGIEALTYNVVMRGGTTTLTKSEFLATGDKMGTEFGSNASLDYGEMNMLGLKEFFNKSWELFTDAILNPAFNSDEFTNKKAQFISYAKQNEADPDGKLQQLTLKTTFKGKNYEKTPGGTSESLENLTLEDIKSFYKENVCKKRAFLVIAGNISESEIIEKVKSTLAKLPEGTPPNTEELVKIEQAGQDIVERKISTNYLCGIMSSIPWNSPDAIAMMVAMDIMYDKYFVELRTKRGLSYAPAAYLNGDAITNPYNVFYITTDHPKEALQIMVDIINDVKKNGFTERDLKDSKDAFLTRYFMRLETAANQSLNIGRWQLRGSVNSHDSFESLINSVTVQDINRVFNGATGSLKWTYLGDPAKVSPEDFKQIEKIGF